MTMRDALEMIHEQEIHARAAKRADDGQCARRRAFGDDNAEARRDFGDEAGDDGRRGAGDAALEQKRRGVVDQARQQGARGVIADVDPISRPVRAEPKHGDAGEPRFEFR